MGGLGDAGIGRPGEVAVAGHTVRAVIDVDAVEGLAQLQGAANQLPGDREADAVEMDIALGIDRALVVHYLDVAAHDRPVADAPALEVRGAQALAQAAGLGFELGDLEIQQGDLDFFESTQHHLTILIDAHFDFRFVMRSVDLQVSINILR